MTKQMRGWLLNNEVIPDKGTAAHDLILGQPVTHDLLVK
jgi:hypothetical protein